MRAYFAMSSLCPLPRRMLRMASAGSTLIDLLVGCVIALLTGAALVSLQQSSYMASSTIQGQNLVNASIRQPLDVLSDTLRNAQIPAGGNQALDSAASSDVTCYTATGTTRLWLDTSTHTLYRSRTDNSGTVTENVLSAVQSLQLTYYIATGNPYNADVTNWGTTADPNAPTAGEMPGIGGISVSATVTVNGETRTLQNFVRLRNSPKPSDS